MNIKFLLPKILLISFFLQSCEEEVAIIIPPGEEQLIVQGHIEQEAPPFVVLTRSMPALSTTDTANFKSAFVRDAIVRVKHHNETVVLAEKSVKELSKTDKILVSALFGFPVKEEAGSQNNYFVYTTTSLKGVIGEKYDLEITVEGKTLTASTSIPNFKPVDSLWFVPHPNVENDSLVTLWYKYQDPDTLGNQVRYFTRRNGEPYYAGRTSSVFNDEFVNGRTINFPVERGRPKSAPINAETDSYFTRGDTVYLKWAAIDFAHYQFWFTLEADRASNGNPLGFPTTVRSNIKGGLGIWGGYGVSLHTIVAPPK